LAAAAVVGSMYYSLPAGCSPYAYGGYGYYSCGGVYYEPRYEGDTVVYVTVPDPSGGKAPAEGAAPAPSGAPAPPGEAAPPPTGPAPPMPSGDAVPPPTAPAPPTPSV
jgi:hypothetical protein